MAEDKVERAVRLALKCDWSDLGVVEHDDGTLLWPAAIERRAKDGSLHQVPVMLRPISNPQRFQARVRSREWAKKLELDPAEDKDLIEQLENWECLAFAIRDAAPPYDQHVFNGEALFNTYSAATLAALWSKLGNVTQTLDPRYGDLDANDFWRVVVRVAAQGEPSPLGGMLGFEQATCIVLMARAACSSPRAPYWVRSLSISGSDSSPKPKLDGSSESPSATSEAV